VKPSLELLFYCANLHQLRGRVRDVPGRKRHADEPSRPKTLSRMPATSAVTTTAKESRSADEDKGLRILWRVIRSEGADQWTVALTLSTSLLPNLFSIRHAQHVEVAAASHQSRRPPAATKAPTQREDISIAETASHAAQGGAGCGGGRMLRGLRIRHVPGRPGVPPPRPSD